MTQDHTEPTATFSLSQVVKLTGISKQSLHAWERRYGVVSPLRSETKRRVYTEDHIARLLLLKKCVSIGHRIGRIAQLDRDELLKLASQNDELRTPAIEHLVDLVEAHRVAEMDADLNFRFMALGPVSFAQDLVPPLMREVGRRWASGSMSISAEHMLTASIRSLLGTGLKFDGAIAGGIRGIFLTPEGEPHELGLLVAALTAKHNGIQVLYIGTQIPLCEIVAVAEKTAAKLVCIGSSIKCPDELERHTYELRNLMPPEIHIWLGGHSYGEADIKVCKNLKVFRDLRTFEQAIQTLRVLEKT
jgi:MerR family transcriptional regulator, light-induced transcriptional regulator